MDATELGKLLGLNERHVRRLAKTGLFPHVGRARFDARVCVPAFVRYLRQGAEQNSAQAAEKLKHTAAQRREIEQRTAARARKLVPIDEVNTVFLTSISLVRGQLDGLAGRCCNDVAAEADPASCKEILFRETRRIAEAAASDLETYAGLGREAAAPAGSADGG